MFIEVIKQKLKKYSMHLRVEKKDKKKRKKEMMEQKTACEKVGCAVGIQ